MVGQLTEVQLLVVQRVPQSLSRDPTHVSPNGDQGNEIAGGPKEIRLPAYQRHFLRPRPQAHVGATQSWVRQQHKVAQFVVHASAPHPKHSDLGRPAFDGKEQRQLEIRLILVPGMRHELRPCVL